MKTRTNNKIKWAVKKAAAFMLTAFFAFLTFSIFYGCANKEYIDRVKTVEIYIPTSCDIATPHLGDMQTIISADSPNAAQEKRLGNEASIYIYTESLEEVLSGCKGER
ncbi:MAG: hypothetical protein LBF71_05550 [Campylobacteraceae bacterium]|nr:hypothetical protein [Campylobacteraceae bacterium]